MWQTIDGKLFSTQAAAVAYEADIVRINKILKIMVNFDMSPMVRQTLCEFMNNNRVALRVALT